MPPQIYQGATVGERQIFTNKVWHVRCERSVEALYHCKVLSLLHHRCLCLWIEGNLLPKSSFMTMICSPANIPELKNRVDKELLHHLCLERSLGVNRSRPVYFVNIKASAASECASMAVARDSKIIVSSH